MGFIKQNPSIQRLNHGGHLRLFAVPDMTPEGVKAGVRNELYPLLVYRIVEWILPMLLLTRSSTFEATTVSSLQFSVRGPVRSPCF